MRLLYVSRSSGGHDERFVSAWRTAGFQVETLTIEADTPGVRARIARRLAAFKPDLVQVGPITEPGWDVSQHWDGPMIGTSWGFDVLDETRLDPDRAQRASEVLKRCDLVFVDNDAPQREVIALGADPTRIVQFPWGLSADWFAGPAPQVPLTGSYVTFLSTRRHEPVYRVGDIVDAFLEVAATHSHARLEIAGSGSLTSGYREAVAIRGLQSQVSFLGELTPGDLRDRYRAADVYVTASSVDGTSVSLLEAMASGRCVVASRIEGNAQWVDDSTGFDFQCGEIEALSGIMSDLLRDSNEVRVGAQARADAARVRVEQKANWPRTVDQFSGFARQAIRNSKERA